MGAGDFLFLVCHTYSKLGSMGVRYPDLTCFRFALLLKWLSLDTLTLKVDSARNRVAKSVK